MIGLLVCTLAVLSAGAQQDTLKFRICLKDKAVTEYSLQRPEEFLSAKALERRHRQGLEVDSTDLPDGVVQRFVGHRPYRRPAFRTLHRTGLDAPCQGGGDAPTRFACEPSREAS